MKLPARLSHALCHYPLTSGQWLLVMIIAALIIIYACVAVSPPDRALLVHPARADNSGGD